jgi:modulator of FtsH protease
VLAADIYRPEEWHDFFVMLGGAAAVLTGLVFVALSLNLDDLLKDVMHRARSIGTLTNFVGIFAISAAALMGEQTHVSIGIVWLFVSIGAGFVSHVRSWPTARRVSPPSRMTSVRFMTGSALYLGEAVGAVLLISGLTAGLYVAASSMTLLAVYSVTGAWLLVVGARNEH